MSTLQQLQNNLSKGWDHLAEGWQQLRQRATHALTKFQPSRAEDSLQTVADQMVRDGSRWGLLATDIQETDDEVIVRLEAPGMETEDFDIQVLDDVLIVRGQKHFEQSRKQGAYHVLECAYGSFERAIPLPVEVDHEQSKASYKRGVLRVELSKRANVKKRRINVKVV